MNAVKAGLLLLGLISSAKFDETVRLIATTTTMTYDEAASRLSCLLKIRGYQLEMPIEAYQLIISSGLDQTIHILDESLVMPFEETADILSTLCNVEVAPGKKPAERRNPIMGLSAVKSAFPAHNHRERWHTAATGE